MEQPSARRRPVLKAALGGLAAVGAVGGAVRGWPGADPTNPSGGRPVLALAGDGDDGADGADGISELELPLDDPTLGHRTSDGRWETRPLESTAYSMLALTWDRRDTAPALEVRTRRDGRWGDWRPVPTLVDGPDTASGEDGDEATGVASTDLVWAGPSDGVVVRVGGVAPRGLTLVLLQPRSRPGDDQVDEPPARTPAASGSRAGHVPRPRLHGRHRWGADGSWRDGPPRYNRTIQQVHVHHTVSSNDYGRGDVPALIRGMYRYHTHYLGWSDIGYNFLVDRFGRIWTGRAGGASRSVRGAHTLGFNSTSAGVAVIGNFEVARPSDAVLDAIAAVAAWKLQPFGRDPLGNVRVWSQGSDRFRRGREVGLPTIDGHRDTNQTACPGRHLYHHIPEVRHRAAALVRRYSKVRVVEPPALHGSPALGRTLTVDPGSYSPAGAALSYVWLRDDHVIPRASGATYDVRPADVGTRLSVNITARQPGLEPVTRRRWSSGRTSSPSMIALGVSAESGGRLGVVVRVTSPPGVRPVPRGRVVVEAADRRAVVRLVDGRGVATFGATRRIKRGRYRVTAAFLGDPSHDASHAAARIHVRP